jgi:hypothetical protein
MQDAKQATKNATGDRAVFRFALPVLHFAFAQTRVFQPDNAIAESPPTATI